jgi:uncharacterized C2H2 Zn-finger protein
MEKSDFTVVSRHDLENEKCPRCLTIFVNFMVVGENLLGCLNCGSIFVKKEVREFVRDHQKEIMQIHKFALPPVGDHACGCGFEAKTKAGLKAHQRKCENG